MKKLLLFFPFLFCCTFLFGQAKMDSVPIKKYTPMFIPNVGFSLFMGAYGKVGTWVKITNRFYGEVGYAYYYSVGDNGNYYESSSRHKFLFGINFFNKRQTFFQNISIRKAVIYDHYIIYKPISQASDKHTKVNDDYYYSYNVGWMKKFTQKNHSLGVLTKVGVMWPVFSDSYFPPLVFEISLFYSL